MGHIPADVRAQVAPILAKAIARIRAEDAAAEQAQRPEPKPRAS